jgi:hypothetical protein
MVALSVDLWRRTEEAIADRSEPGGGGLHTREVPRCRGGGCQWCGRGGGSLLIPMPRLTCIQPDLVATMYSDAEGVDFGFLLEQARAQPRQAQDLTMSWHQIRRDGESNSLTLSDESVQFESDELEVRDRSP